MRGVDRVRIYHSVLESYLRREGTSMNYCLFSGTIDFIVHIFVESTFDSFSTTTLNVFSWHGRGLTFCFVKFFHFLIISFCFRSRSLNIEQEARRKEKDKSNGQATNAETQPGTLKA